MLIGFQTEESPAWHYGKVNEDVLTNAKVGSGNESCVACCSFSHNRVSILVLLRIILSVPPFHPWENYL